MKYRAAMFDLDGTLLDTLDDLADSMNATLASLSLPTHPTEAYKTFVGDGIHNLVLRVAPAALNDEKLAETLLDGMRSEYAKRWADKTRPYDGVDKMLTTLTDRGVRMTILSNKPHDMLKLCVDRLLTSWRFEAVRGVDERTPAKPDPSGALAIAEQLGASPEEIIYLGDTNTDMQTAVAVGMFAVGVTWGFRDESELRDNGADAIITHPSELFSLM